MASAALVKITLFCEHFSLKHSFLFSYSLKKNATTARRRLLIPTLKYSFPWSWYYHSKNMKTEVLKISSLSLKLVTVLNKNKKPYLVLWMPYLLFLVFLWTAHHLPCWKWNTSLTSVSTSNQINDQREILGVTANKKSKLPVDWWLTVTSKTRKYNL